jgi:hypothetical protein
VAEAGEGGLFDETKEFVKATENKDMQTYIK